MPKARISVILLLWGVVLLFLTRQVPLGDYAVVGNLALFGLVFLTVIRLGTIPLRSVVIIATFFVGLSAYSCFLGNNLSSIIRFFFVLFFVLLAYFIELPAKQTIRLLFIFTFIQVVVIVILEIICLFFLDAGLQKSLRFFSLAKGWGDIYPSGSLFKIQIKGTAILPFVYFLSYAVKVFPRKYRMTLRIAYVAAILFAGNFAYILGLLAFHTLWYFWRANDKRVLFNRIIIGSIIMLMCALPVYFYVSNTMQAKSGESNAIRIEQTEVMLSDMQENTATILLGKGLGNAVQGEGNFRTYDGDQYFELQTLYIFNQLGFLFFSVFLIANIWLTRLQIKKPSLWLIYGCYILYALTNPYILDTTQVVVIISLIAAKNLMTDEDRLRISSL